MYDKYGRSGLLVGVAAGAFVTGALAGLALSVYSKKTRSSPQGGRAEILVLTDTDVKASITMREAIQTNARAFAAEEEGVAVVPERHVLPIPNFHGFTLFKPAFIPGPGAVGAGALGLKVVSPRPHNAQLGLATIPATVLLFDEATGLASALVDATYLTALRTAAGSGVATERLACVGAKVLTVFGAGLQAECHIDAMIAVRPTIETIYIVNRSRPRAERLASWCLRRHGNIQRVEALLLSEAARVEAATRAADCICACTNSSTPVVRGEWLKAGAHINGVGSYTPQMQEVDAVAVRMCRVIIDTPHALPVGDLAALGKERDDVIKGTIGALVTGALSLKHDATSFTFFKSVGVAVQDVATAHAVVRRAVSKGMGKRV